MSSTRPSLTAKQRAFVWLQRVLPTLWLSQLAHVVTRSQRPWLKRRLITRFMTHFGISLEEARQTAERLGLPIPSPLPGA